MPSPARPAGPGSRAAHPRPRPPRSRPPPARPRSRNSRSWNSCVAAGSLRRTSSRVSARWASSVRLLKPIARRHALEGVHGAEDPGRPARWPGIALPFEQELVAGAEVLAALASGRGRRSAIDPSVNRGRAVPPRARGEGWNGLTTKSLAPAWIASTTSACWPMALHIRILASGSVLQISRTASMPPMSGITMSMVTRSGLSCAVLLDRLAPGLGLADDLEARLREDVADHRAHEDGVVADEYGMAHAILLLRTGSATGRRFTPRSGGASSASVSSTTKTSSLPARPRLGPGGDRVRGAPPWARGRREVRRRDRAPRPPRVPATSAATSSTSTERSGCRRLRTLEHQMAARRR